VERNTYIEGWKGPRCDGLEASVRAVESYIEEEGPFEGILGFSQGDLSKSLYT